MRLHVEPAEYDRRRRARDRSGRGHSDKPSRLHVDRRAPRPVTMWGRLETCGRLSIGLPGVAVVLLTTACTHHRAPSTYRYLKQDNARFLIPPGVADASTFQRAFNFRTTAPRRPACTLSENS